LAGNKELIGEAAIDLYTIVLNPKKWYNDFVELKVESKFSGSIYL